MRTMMKKVIIIAPHPDDEVLGCGGTILKHKQEGDMVAVLYVTNCLPEYGFSQDRYLSRQKEIKDVQTLSKIDKIFKLDLPTTKLDMINIGEIIKQISAIFLDYKPNTIYINNQDDAHSDHYVAFKAAYSCTKSFRYPFIEKVYVYEVPSETEFGYNNKFHPTSFVDISTFVDTKLKMMSVYESEVMEFPYPRSLDSIKALARWRGSRICVEYAEAFMLLFEKK